VDEQAAPALRPEAGLAAVEQRRGQRGLPDGVRRHPQQSQGVGVVDLLDDDAGEPVDDAAAGEDGLRYAEGGDRARVVPVPGQRLHRAGHRGAGRRSGVRPPAAQRRPLQQVEGEGDVSRRGCPTGGVAQLEHPGRVAGHAVVEDLPHPQQAGLVQLRQRRERRGVDEAVHQLGSAQSRRRTAPRAAGGDRVGWSPW
jgi:hypothetical protein